MGGKKHDKNTGVVTFFSRSGKFAGLVLATLAAFAGPLVWSSQQASASADTTVSSYNVKGVAVKKYTPVHPNGKSPIVMVHGGAHAAWAWDKMATELSGMGWECHVINWYNHGDSKVLPEEDFIQRSIVDVARQEIKHVVKELDQEPILMGHSMGGLAALSYAEHNPVKQLVLLTPVMPASVQPEPIPLPVDLTQPFQPFPYELAKQLFFTTLSDDEARHYHSLLVAESPVAVVEATQWTVDIDLSKIHAPTLVFGAELDRLTPAVSVERMAAMMNAQYEFAAGIGHSDILLKDPEWRSAADKINLWLGEGSANAD